MKPITVSALLILIPLAALAKTLVIGNEPIKVTLPINQELRIEFPEAVLDLNLPAALDQSLDTFLKPDGVLYWTAKAPVHGRAIATTADGTVILLDLDTRDRVSDEARVIRLIAPKQIKRTQITPGGSGGQDDQLPAVLRDTRDNDAAVTGGPDPISYATLARFVLQHYLGPRRLIMKLDATRLDKPSPEGRLLRVWNDRVGARVLDAWKYQNLYLTAVLVHNRTSSPYHFDPRAIRGRYLFVAALDPVIAPRGALYDDSIWVFISGIPFARALGTN